MSDDVDVDEAQPWGRWLLRQSASWLGTVVLLLALLAVMGRLRAPTLPELAPDFRLLDENGDHVQLSALRGQPVVINFWATWCGPCRVEMPLLSRWARTHPDVVVLGVATDRDPDVVRRLLPRLDLSYKVLFDDGAVQRAYGVSTLPTTVVIGADGVVKGAHTGLLVGWELDVLLR